MGEADLGDINKDVNEATDVDMIVDDSLNEVWK